MSEKSLSRRNLLGGSAGLAAGAVFMSALNPAAAAAPAVSDLAKTDPEYARFFKYFDEEEVAKTVEPILGKAHRHFVILAALLGCGGKEEFEVRLPQALDAGVTPTQVREIVYQATAYLGMGRVRGFVDIMNRVFTSRGVKLPLPDTTEQKDVERVVKGEAAQVEIFGAGMKGFATSGPEKTVAIRRWLSANCFGDYYVRSGLSLQERELVTFCYLAAQGDTTAQMAAHAAGNLKMGNTEAILIAACLQLAPLLGYPRTLNALAVVEKAAHPAK